MAKFPWAASGRAIANARDEGFTKLLFDADNHRIVGGGIVGTDAGDLISELALAIEMGADATDIGKTIHPHPTLGESVGMAAEAVRGRLHRPAAAEERTMTPGRAEESRWRRRRCKYVVEDERGRRRLGLDGQFLHRRPRHDQGPHRGRGGRLGGERASG